MSPAATTMPMIQRRPRFTVGSTTRTRRVALEPPERALPPRDRDPVVGEGLRLVGLRLDQGLLRVGELDDVGHPRVEPAARELIVLARRLHRLLGPADSPRFRYDCSTFCQTCSSVSRTRAWEASTAALASL